MKKSSVGEPSLHDVLLAVNDLSTNMDQRFNAVDRRFGEIDKRFEKNDLELFSIRNNMATKQDVAELTSRIDRFEHEVMKSIDGFGVLCQKFDVELLALRSRFIRMETFVHKVAERLSMKSELA